MFVHVFASPDRRSSDHAAELHFHTFIFRFLLFRIFQTTRHGHGHGHRICIKANTKRSHGHFDETRDYIPALAPHVAPAGDPWVVCLTSCACTLFPRGIRDPEVRKHCMPAHAYTYCMPHDAVCHAMPCCWRKAIAILCKDDGCP